MYDCNDLLTRIEPFTFRPEHIGILPFDGSTYYAWYDDGSGRTSKSYLLHFTLETIDNRIHLVTERKHPEQDAPVPVASTTEPLYAGLSIELDDEQRLAVARAVRSLYVSRAFTVTALQDEYQELGQIPRDVRDPVFIAGRTRRVKILRQLSVLHYQAVLVSRFANETNERLDAQGTPPGINYQRNW